MRSTSVILEAIKAKPIPSDGICGNFEILYHMAYGDYPSITHLDSAIAAWPDNNGSMLYPVSDPTGLYGPMQAFEVYDKWGDSAYADKRRELLDWLIKWFRESEE